MTRPGLYATTAISLYLSSHAGMSMAQISELTSDELSVFAPAVQECFDSPDAAEACLPLRALIAECAIDLSDAECDTLLSDSAALSDDPEMQARAQQALMELDDTLQFLEADLQPDLAEGVDPAGAEEPVSEAGQPDDEAEEPEAAPEELPEPEVEAESEAADPETTDEGETVADEEDTALDRLGRALEEMTQEEEPDAEPSSEEARDAPDEEVVPAPEELTEHEDATVSEPADPETTDGETAPDEEGTVLDRLGRALEEITRAEEPAPAESPAAEDETAEPSAEEIEAERAMEEERQRMIREAEEMADEAPELIVEDVPEEEVVAPAEAPRELDPAQQAAIEELMQSPDVSSAIGVLGAMLGVSPETTTPEDEVDTRPLAARLPDDADEDSPQVESDDVIEEQITRDQVRTSRDDFDSRLTLDADADAQARADRRARDRRDLERAGLAALGALAVGMVINQNRVVARSDERVVVDQGDGALDLWRDDDAILLQDGSTRRIERYDDGSTRTRWMRTDGTETITIRDATGRVLRRERVLADGTIVLLLDDTRPVEVIDVSVLPPPRTRELRISPRSDPELALAMLREAEAEARALDRRFSLRQIRESREVRELVPLLSPDLITFETNRANVRPEEAAKLLQVGRLMERLISEDPRELFLIEGHTDATGPAAFNLALSDRRAESVAIALTEFFDIPPENLIVQGYGKRYLRIPTLEAEVRNRRVAIRRITPLLWE
ncbi:OmpA family protein [Natronohydrobacter thiooxidans]|uniref:OmpA family protein n=1 Tax=Natronohydrobacter thiooxidans TaxID=87172 RepID=UPI0009FFF07E|nr:OmpA family protein [Natronohydrobacter thiooxidans]